MHSGCMTTDLALKYLGTAVPVSGVNPFYLRRVLQRCERDELTLLDAAELLLAAARRGGTTIDAVATGTGNSFAVTRGPADAP
jgi:hypothetical protein